jgi:carboxymethylenebutenolidase
MRMSTALATALALTNAAFAEEAAQQRLTKSPRHQEWVRIEHGGRTLHAFVVFPEVKEKAAAVVVIHEIFGMTDWVRSVADQLAEAGYIAIAPDLLSGMGPKGEKSSDFVGVDAARKAVSELPPAQVTADLKAAADYVGKLPAANGKVSVGGFCWGGREAFRFATDREGLSAAYVFYGNGPTDKAAIARIKCPVYGFYGGNDARVTATVETTNQSMKAAGKQYEPIVYEGAGHGFLRRGELAESGEADKKARAEAWERWKALLARP